MFQCLKRSKVSAWTATMFDAPGERSFVTNKGDGDGSGWRAATDRECSSGQSASLLLPPGDTTRSSPLSAHLACPSDSYVASGPCQVSSPMCERREHKIPPGSNHPWRTNSGYAGSSQSASQAVPVDSLKGLSIPYRLLHPQE